MSSVLDAWDDRWNTNILSVDQEHKRLYEIFVSLNDACLEGLEGSVIQSIIEELLDYTDKHFANEEAMLEKYGYKNLEEHQAIHRDLKEQVKAFKEKILSSSDRTAVAYEVGAFVETWLIQHILEEDFKYLKHVEV
ncbi:bacteriohemerythrin [Magnetococcales bacterium HHB-1]